MKRCNKCGKEHKNDFEICDECGEALVHAQVEQLDENKNNDDNEDNDVSRYSGPTFCIYCGGTIVGEQRFCSKCGRSSINEDVRHCIECGTQLVKEQKFCAKCGQKVSNIVIPKGVDEAVTKVKKIGLKKIVMTGVILVTIIVLMLVGKIVIPKMFVSVEEYMAQGNYAKAYDKADKEEQEEVLLENLIAFLCAEAKTQLKDEDSFKLRQVWYDREENRLVLKIQGANSYGGDVSSYWYYTFDNEEQEYQLWTSVSDFEEEETYSWDDFDEKFEKILKNAAKKTIEEIVEDKSNELDSEMVKRINNLNKQEILEDVELLDNIKKIYPKGKEEA